MLQKNLFRHRQMRQSKEIEAFIRMLGNNQQGKAGIKMSEKKAFEGVNMNIIIKDKWVKASGARYHLISRSSSDMSSSLRKEKGGDSGKGFLKRVNQQNAVASMAGY